MDAYNGFVVGSGRLCEICGKGIHGGCVFSSRGQLEHVWCRAIKDADEAVDRIKQKALEQDNDADRARITGETG